MQEGLENLEEWSKNSLLHLNEDKCVQMIFSNGRSNREIRSNELHDKQLKRVGEDLGVIIDSKHSFDSHIFPEIKQTKCYHFSF